MNQSFGWEWLIRPVTSVLVHHGLIARVVLEMSQDQEKYVLAAAVDAVQEVGTRAVNVLVQSHAWVCWCYILFCTHSLSVTQSASVWDHIFAAGLVDDVMIMAVVNITAMNGIQKIPSIAAHVSTGGVKSVVGKQQYLPAFLL